MNYTKNQDNKYNLSLTNAIIVSLLMPIERAWWRPGPGETLLLSLQLCIQRRQTGTRKSTVLKVLHLESESRF